MNYYKILKEDLCSPFYNFQWEIGKKFICDNFDESNKSGFYYLKTYQLPVFHTLIPSSFSAKPLKIYQVEIGNKKIEKEDEIFIDRGKYKNYYFSVGENRCKKMKLIKKLNKKEIKELFKKENYGLYKISKLK